MEKSLFESLKKVLWQYKEKFFLGFLMLLVSNGLLIFNPLVFRQAVIAVDPNSPVEEGILHDFFWWLWGAQVGNIWVWAPSLLLIAILSAYLKYQMRVTFITVSRDVEVEIRSKLFSRIQSQSMAFFDNHGIGELLSRLTNDISAYRDVLGPGIMYPLFFLTLVIPGLAALFFISTKLAVISMIPMILIPIVNFAIRGRLYELSKRVQKSLADLSNMAQEHYSAIRTIKSYVIENTLFKYFLALCNSLVSMNLRLATLQGALFPFFTFLTKVTTVVLVLFSGFVILKGWGELSAADFVSFMWIQSYIFFPVLMLAWLIPVFERGRAAYDRLLEIYEEPIEVVDHLVSELKIPVGARLAFRNLTFRYPSQQIPALSNFNLEIEGGAFVGITGPVGAGKSTLFKLLNREYEIPEGMIEIGGRDIHKYPLSAFHMEVVTVEQVPFLFSKSIEENVKFGKREATKEEIEEVSRFADFHETVLDFPEQYHTLVGERGVTLSGGQKQRLAMARAFLVNRSILLLDDIFSAVDSDTEARIFQSMRRNFKGKTVLLITHRMSILEQMDRVIYLSGGQVSEEGTPKELMQLGGQYAALVELQRIDRHEKT
ncbi:multidrug resistance-like ATP-binding protein MdlA [Waddlia chondrophila 2032/99]|uniref:Multidrug resistance-like ATP-binding protein MdlA n=1 Tax=Waddlia chondrophila 2032/99 TaxID=765953 RepID=F8LB88_9BACT|nr:multidrug resistance-like ATP-binding protein MdlA [Waddlia chondrophila 2032/99]